MLARLSLLALCASLASAENYAVLVCGSNGYGNYRHHADIAHAYQILTKGGVKAENIITMMYDDVASSDENPYPGKLFNKPAKTLKEANEVYASVKDHIDYSGDQVTPENFVAVLTGDSAGANGKRVLTSGPNDNVFVNFADHGGVGLLGFPTTIMSEKDLSAALDKMYKKKMYKQLVFYLEACESGSMFENLPTDRNIYALSAANAKESSWGTYCGPTLDSVEWGKGTDVVGGKSIGSCLGDLFSVNWMENVDVTDLSGETLTVQFKKVKKLTDLSHVLQWGQTSIASEDASVFEGTGNTAPSQAAAAARKGGNVDSRDIKLASLYGKYTKSAAAERPRLAAQLIKEIQHREAEDAKFASIARKAGLPEELETTQKPANRDCFHAGHVAVGQVCGGYSDYSLKHARVIAGACNHHNGNATVVVDAVKAVCAY